MAFLPYIAMHLDLCIVLIIYLWTYAGNNVAFTLLASTKKPKDTYFQVNLHVHNSDYDDTKGKKAVTIQKDTEINQLDKQKYNTNLSTHHGVGIPKSTTSSSVGYESSLNDNNSSDAIVKDKHLGIRLKRAVISISEKSRNRRRHERQRKKSNFITPEENKPDIVDNNENKKGTKTRKATRRQKAFHMPLPFPNTELDKIQYDENDNMTNNTYTDLSNNKLTYDSGNSNDTFNIKATGVGVNENYGTGQSIIVVNDHHDNETKLRRVKRHRMGKKVRVPLPYNTAQMDKKGNKKKDQQHTSSTRRHKKNRKRLPPLH